MIHQHRWHGGLGIAAAALAAVPVLTGCGAGADANTRQEVFGEGSYWRVGNLKLLDFQLAAPPGATAISGTAYLVGQIYNQGPTDDQITQMSFGDTGVVGSAPAGSTATSASPSAAPSSSFSFAPGPEPTSAPSSAAGGGASASGVLPITIPSGGHVAFGPGTGHVVVVRNLSSALRIGQDTTMMISTAKNGSSPGLAIPLTIITGTTAVSTPVTATTQSYPAEHVNPTWSRPPYDDRSFSKE